MPNPAIFSRDVMVPVRNKRAALPGDPDYRLMPDGSTVFPEARNLAYKIYVELSTRKIGVPIDWEDDCIHEIYNSWFNFMQEYREILKQVYLKDSTVRLSTSHVYHGENTLKVDPLYMADGLYSRYI